MTIRKNDLGDGRSFHGIRVDCRMPDFFYGVETAYYISGSEFRGGIYEADPHHRRI